MKSLLNKMDTYINFDKASAHCDVPCGIYDPISAQIAALTVVRMVDLIEEQGNNNHGTPEFRNRIMRLVLNKEEHAEKAKHEIRVIWGDFIKPKHVEEFPEIHQLVHSIMALGSEAKQHVSREVALELLEKINEFAEIFWKIKGMETVKSKAPYAPNLELVYRKL